MRLKYVGIGLFAVFAVIAISSSDKPEAGTEPLAEQAPNLPQEASEDAEAATVSSSMPAKPLGGRRLGLDVNMASDNDYGKAFAAAKAAGVQVVSLSLNWDQVEAAPEKYDDTYPAIANVFYPPQKTAVSLVLRPLDTNGYHLPEDLKGKDLSDPEVIARFNKFVDHVLSAMPNVELNSIGIGNEIDHPLGTDKGAWADYEEFFIAVKQHIKSAKSSIPIGAVVTYGGLVGKSSSLAASLNRHADVVITTHYLLNEDFTVQGPAAVHKVFSDLASLSGDKPVYVQELGFPSSTANKSSEELQKRFIEESFKAWDENAAAVPFVMFSWMHDRSASQVNDFKSHYGLSDKKFLEYLRTLGLRTHEGGDKPGFAAFKAEAKKRGW